MADEPIQFKKASSSFVVVRFRDDAGKQHSSLVRGEMDKTAISEALGSLDWEYATDLTDKERETLDRWNAPEREGA